MLSCSISSWDLIKCPYFADTTERGDRGWEEAKRPGEDRVYFLDNSNIFQGLWLFLEHFLKNIFFAWWNIWVSIILLFFLKIRFKVNGKATVWHTPCWTLTSQDQWPRRKGCMWNRVRVDNMQGFFGQDTTIGKWTWLRNHIDNCCTTSPRVYIR
jgi:hypothetical protein